MTTCPHHWPFFHFFAAVNYYNIPYTYNSFNAIVAILWIQRRHIASEVIHNVLLYTHTRRRLSTEQTGSCMYIIVIQSALSTIKAKTPCSNLVNQSTCTEIYKNVQTLLTSKLLLKNNY